MAKKKVRDSWRRQEQHGSKAAFWLIVRRLVSTSAVLALFGLLIYILILPSLRPGTYFVYMTSAQREPANGAPIQYSFEDFNALTPLVDGLTSRIRGESPLTFTGLEDPRGALEQFEQLARLGLRRRDRLVLYITAHGEVDAGIPYLQCSNYQADDPEKGRLKLEEVLRAIAELPCATKLLVLDVSRTAWSPEKGDQSATFTQRLASQIDNLQSPGLWVMTSSRGLERSLVSPALRQSVFGYIFSKGMRGAADWDENKQLRLDELFHFVNENVSAFASQQTGGHASQTPQLFHHDLDELQRRPPDLFNLKKLPSATKPNVVADVKDAQSTDSNSTLSNVGNYIVGVSGQFGIPSPTTIKLRLRPVTNLTSKLIGGSDDEEEDEEPTEVLPEATTNPELEPEFVAASRLKDAWRLVDQLDSSVRAQPELTGSNDDVQVSRIAPAQVAPDLWQAMLEELLWYDQLHHAGHMVDQDHVAARVRRIANELRFLRGETGLDPVPRSSPAWKIAQQNSDLPISLDAVRSFGLAESLATHALPNDREQDEVNPPPESLRNLIEAFDQSLQSTDSALLDAILEKADAPTRQFHELRLAVTLRGLNIDWPLVKTALSIRRLAEQTAADRLIGSGWGRHDIESGDRSRWEAERLIQSQATKDWRQRAADSFVSAREHYRSAASALASVRRATVLRDRVLGRCQSYIQWLAKQDSLSTSPQTLDFKEVCQAVRAIDQVLLPGIVESDNDDMTQMDQLQRAYSGLLYAYERMENGLTAESLNMLANDVTGNGWRIESLTRTTLLDAKSRAQLVSALAEVSTELVGKFEFKRSRPNVVVADTSITDSAWSSVAKRIDVELLRASLATSALDLLKTLRTSDSVEQLAGIGDNVFAQLHAAGLATVGDVARAPTDVIVDALKNSGESANALRNVARWHELDSFVLRLTGFYQQLPTAILDVVRSARATKDVVQRQYQLRTAAHDLHLLASVDGLEPSPNTDILNGDWYRYLNWRATRSSLAASDTTSGHRNDAANDYRHYASLAEQIHGFSPLPDMQLAELDISIDSEVSLEKGNRGEISVHIESGSVVETPVWLVLQYDDSKISVRTEQGVRIFREDKLRSDLASASLLSPLDNKALRHPVHLSQYPYRPDVIYATEPTTRVPASGSRRIRLQVQHLDGARGQTQLVVKAVGGSSYVRGISRIKLPGDQLYDLVLEDPTTRDPLDRNSWQRLSGGVMLMPFPNREQTIMFGIQDRSHQDSKLQIELFHPGRRPNLIALPTGAVDPDLASDVLRPFGPLRSIGKSPELKLTANRSTPVSFESVHLESVGTATSTTDGKASDGSVAGLSVSNGLIMVISDLDRNQKTIKHIDFSVKRPIRYVEANAGYNVSDQRLTVNIRVPDASSIPQGGVRAKLDFAETVTFSEAMSPQLELRLATADEWVQLYAPVAAADRRDLTALVSIDGYPRAFVFRVSCTETRRGIAAEANLKGVRIVQPKSGSSVSAKELQATRKIPVRVEVDAPVQAFSSPGTDFVEVGIDRDRDRKLSRADPVVRLLADRQVKLFVTALSADGTMTFLPHVDDFDIDLPADGLLNRRPFLLGRLTTGNSSVSSPEPPVEYIVDGSGPAISIDSISVNGTPAPEEITVEQKTEIVLTVVDALTRVEKVEVGFGMGRKGDFTPIGDPKSAQPIEATKWRVEVTPPLPLGPKRLWIRATDSVGNPTVEDYRVVVIAKSATRTQATNQDSATTQKDSNAATATTAGTKRPTTTSVIGRLRYGTRIIEDGTVALLRGGKPFKKAKADSKGRFLISDVPAGTYLLECRGTGGGNTVTAKLDITVAKPSLGPKNVQTIPLR